MVSRASRTQRLASILLRAESGTGRVGSGSDQDPAWGTDLASAGGPLRRLGLHVLYFNNPRTARMLVDVGTVRGVKMATGQEDGSAEGTL